MINRKTVNKLFSTLLKSRLILVLINTNSLEIIKIIWIILTMKMYDVSLLRLSRLFINMEIFTYYQVPNNRTVMNPYFRYIFQPLLFLFRALFLCHPMQVTGMLRLLPRTFLPPCSRIIRDGSFSFCNFLKSEILLFALAFSSTNIYVALYYGHHVLCLT